MSLSSDIHELGDVWSRSGYLFKIVVIVSIFLSVSSVASLAERIFEWKGFILDAVNFYRIYIVNTFSVLLAKIGINLDQEKIDYLTITMISVSCMARGGIMLGKEKLKLNEGFFQNDQGIAAVLFWLIFLGLMLTRLDAKEGSLSYVSLFVTVGTTIILPMIIFKEKKIDVLSYFSPLIFAVVIVLFLGALNVGLTKT